MTIEFRACQADDVNEVIPLMYSAGPEAYRYVFSVNYQEQAVDFLHYAFCQGDGEFGYKDHQVAVENNHIVALVGRRSSKNNLAYTVMAIKQIFGFFGFIKAVKVIFRGLRFETIVTPPPRNVVCLHNLAVSDGQQGKGVGQQVIKHFLAQEKAKNTSSVCLDVAETNPRAKVLYQRLGFVVKSKKIGKLKNKYGRGVSHEYMELKL
ncbi:MAG: GNAT family N-acetyltransferase [Colwellia sp.]|nr:GNAT family N-acetyltransferase [Colwellia sp.]